MVKAACIEDHEHGAKCMGMDHDMMPMVTSWADVDAAEAAEEAAEAAGQFQQIVNGILMSDLSPDEKSAAIQAAAADLPSRISGEMNDMKAYRPNAVARFFGAKVRDANGLGPDAYAIVGDADMPSTWKLRIDDASHISGAIQALSPEGFRGQKVQLEAGQRKAALGRIRGAIGRLPDDQKGNLPDRVAALKALTDAARPGSVSVLRAKDGLPERFAMWASNNFQDREGEIFPAAVIRDAVERFNARDGAKGHANVWHVGQEVGLARDLTDWGEIEHAAFVDGFLFVEGKVTQPAAAKAIADWADEEDLGTSIEYTYRASDLQAGVYSSFDFDRVSVVPRKYAANPWTPGASVAVKGGTMPFEGPIAEAMDRIWGADQRQAWEHDLEAQTAALKERGVASKTFEFQPPTVRVAFKAVEDDGQPVAPAVAAQAPAEVTAPATASTDEIPPHMKAILDQLAAISARLDQQDSAVKAIGDRVGELPPAAGVFGRSVTQASQTAVKAAGEVASQDDAVEQYRQSGAVPDINSIGADYNDWGAAGTAMQILTKNMGNGNGQRPAGA